MPRKRRDGLRDSRTWSKISGVTICTIPSGVTINSGGLNDLSSTELGYLDLIAGPAIGMKSSVSTGYMVSGDSAAWAAGGTSLTITYANLGITKLFGFATQYMGSAVSATTIRCNENAGVMSMAVVAPEILGGVTVLGGSGGSVYWMALHT